MLKDNAELLRLLGRVFAVTGERKWSDLAKHVHRFLQHALFLPEAGCWAGSQDADEECHVLPAGRRKQREAPFVDRTIYNNWNAMTARALLEAGAHLAEPHWMEAGERTLRVLWNLVSRPGDGVAHYVIEAGPRLFGQLEDHVMMGRAALSAYMATGSNEWLAISRQLAGFVMAHFTLPAGPAQVDLAVNALALEWLKALTEASAEVEGLPQLATAVTVPTFPGGDPGVDGAPGPWTLPPG